MAQPKKVTSFQKKGRIKALQIPGTKPSLHNNQLLVSTGIPSLDNVLGGGIAVGTLLLVEEDTFGSYSHLVLKYFLAEGVVNGHALFVSSCDTDTRKMVNDLPAPIIDDPGAAANLSTKQAPSSEQDEDMKIAWRYKNMPQVQSGGSRFGHYFDLTKVMDSRLVDGCQIHHQEQSDILSTRGTDYLHDKQAVLSPPYSSTLSAVRKKVKDGGFLTSATPHSNNILRIAIQSLGSPLWGEADPSLNLCRFLYALKAQLRTSYAVAMVTVPTHLFEELSITRRIRHVCDSVMKLEAFAGSDKEQNPAFKEYHGLFHIIKLPRINSLTCHHPDTLDLAFKLRRKKFTIEKLHLPPELSETASRSQEDPVPRLKSQSAASCNVVGSGSANKLDF